MIQFPLPLFVSFVLIAMALFVFWKHKNERLNVPFLALIIVVALQTFIVGLRWGFGIRFFAVLIPPISAVVPSLVYCGVATLVRHDLRPRIQLAAHALGVLAIIVMMVVNPRAVDAALIVLFSGYAFAILLLMRSGSDSLYLESFETAGSAYRSIVFAAFSLLFYAILDAIVFFEVSFASEQNAMWVITIGNISLLIIMGVAAANIGQAGGAQQDAEPARAALPGSPAPAQPDTGAGDTGTEIVYRPEELEKVIADIETLLVTKSLFRDVGLNLDRLARRLAIPARMVSVAINQRRSKNVSQFVNEFRIAEACTLLRTTDQSVTDVMFNVGFQTKSNFNREFRRVTGMTPVQWRGEAIKSPASFPTDYAEGPLPGANPAEG
jgi:AraC-like DNA-binding protein